MGDFLGEDFAFFAGDFLVVGFWMLRFGAGLDDLGVSGLEVAGETWTLFLFFCDEVAVSRTASWLSDEDEEGRELTLC